MLPIPKFHKFRRQINKYDFLLKPIFIGFCVIGAIALIYVSIPPFIKLAQRFVQSSATIISFTKDPAITLNSTNDRTNLLLLGRGGAGHEAPDLTDSMVLISFHHPSKKITFISIPRDVWVDSLKAKINTAYFYGEKKQQGGGLLLTKASVSEITGLPVHYAFVLDFDGFKKAIDLVSGVDVVVDRTFDDFKYPIPGKEDAMPESDRYDHLHFDAGLQHMDGDLALKFVRSRMAEGDEGTDFARSNRQQKVLLAFKDKLLSHQTLLNVDKINELLNLYKQYINTDISSNDYAAFAKLALISDTQNLKSVALTTGDKKTNQFGVLENPPTAKYQGQWVLIAKDGNWDALKQYIQNELAK